MIVFRSRNYGLGILIRKRRQHLKVVKMICYTFMENTLKFCSPFLYESQKIMLE